MLPNLKCHGEEDTHRPTVKYFWCRSQGANVFISKNCCNIFIHCCSESCYLLNLPKKFFLNPATKTDNCLIENVTANSEKILLDLAANQLKLQHWTKVKWAALFAFAFCRVCVFILWILQSVCVHTMDFVSAHKQIN